MPQSDFDFIEIDASNKKLATGPPTLADSQPVVYNPTAAAASAAAAAATDPATPTTKHKKRDGNCAAQPAGSAPSTTPDTDSAFLANPTYTVSWKLHEFFCLLKNATNTLRLLLPMPRSQMATPSLSPICKVPLRPLLTLDCTRLAATTRTCARRNVTRFPPATLSTSTLNVIPARTLVPLAPTRPAPTTTSAPYGDPRSTAPPPRTRANGATSITWSSLPPTATTSSRLRHHSLATLVLPSSAVPSTRLADMSVPNGTLVLMTLASASLLALPPTSMTTTTQELMAPMILA